MIFSQIFENINIGLVVLDREMKVYKWNRWMEMNSGISTEDITDKSIFDFFPNIKTENFIRSCNTVFTFGNFSFFSQKLHGNLFPFKLTGFFDSSFEYMQQTCTMGPLRDEKNEIKYLYIYVQDVTAVAIYEKKLIEMNILDDLTGIYNRRYLETKIQDEFRRHKRYGRPFSIIMFDIDYFKNVNDQHGHLCGDHILKEVSSKISSLARNLDSLFRFGGEEFCCLLPETNLESAMTVAERFRVAIMEQEHYFDGKTIKVSISIGVVEMTKDMETPDVLLNKVDAALYQAKNKGRNSTVAF